MKIYIFLFSSILLIGSLSAQQNGYSITGQVLLDEYLPVKTPAAGAYIQIDGQEEKGYLANSLGEFTIDNLKPGEYKLKFFYVGFFNADTTITIKNRPSDPIKITLPMWYDKNSFSVESALDNINNGYPRLYVCTEKGNVNNYYTAKLAKESKINFIIYEKELIQDKKQFFSAPLPVLVRYNCETFRHLDEKYDKEWRQYAPPGILGLEEWIEKNP